MSRKQKVEAHLEGRDNGDHARQSDVELPVRTFGKKPKPPTPLEVGATWQGLDLHHPELVAAANGARDWFYNLVTKPPGQGLILSGRNGTGKSHIARMAQLNFGPAAVFWSEAELIGSLWAAYSGQGSERALLARCRHAPLLILDDLGTAHVNSWGWLDNIYWQLFDTHPVKGRGGILVTTNLPWIEGNEMPFLERVGGSAGSRLIGLAGGLDEATGRPTRWYDMFNVPDWRER